MHCHLGPTFALLLFLLAAASSVRAQGPETRAEPDYETDPRVIEEQVDQIKEEYQAIKSNQDLEQTRRRRELARRLGRMRHPESVKVLLRIVEKDSDTRAVIVAMHSLARVGDLAAVRRMYKVVVKDRDGVLGAYLGSALAQATDAEVGPWVVAKVLKNSKAPIRLSAVEALGALQIESAREPLLELFEKENGRARRKMHLFYELIRALGQVGGETVWPILEQASRDTDWRVRLAVAEVLPVRFRNDKAVALMRGLLRDEKPIVREISAVSVGEARMEPLFPELILLLREGNLRSKNKSYEAMKSISGQDYGYAPDAWEKWWRDKRAGKLTGEGDIANRESMSVATYYNFKIFSDRVLFVIDVSGSMNWPEYSPNRIEVAKRELVKAIKVLDEKTMFNVATFAGHVNFWQRKGEVPATEENRTKALKWLDSNLLPRGATNTYDALLKSLDENPLVDTIFFLSDGIPSTGKYELPEKILVELRNANRFRKVIFNTIALAMGKASIEKAQKYEDPEEMAAFMRMIAEMTGGTCVDIRKPFLDR